MNSPIVDNIVDGVLNRYSTDDANLNLVLRVILMMIIIMMVMMRIFYNN